MERIILNRNKMDWTGIGTSLGIIGTVIAAAVTFMKKNGTLRQSKILGKKQQKVIQNKLLIQSYIENLRLQLNADRVDIGYTSNGGGEWKTGTHLYSSILFESISQDQISYKDAWHEQLVDGAFLHMLQSMYEADIVLHLVKDMEEGIVKDACITNGTGAVAITSLINADDRNYYIGISWNILKKKETLDHSDRDFTRALKAKLITLIV